MDKQVICIPKEISGLSADTYYLPNTKPTLVPISEVEKMNIQVIVLTHNM